MVIRGNIKLATTPGSGTGDPILTRDATGGDIGYVNSIDSSTFIPTSLTNGYIIVGNASNVATGVAVSGDITVSNTGVVGISSGSIVNSDISNTAEIDLYKIASMTANRSVISDSSGYMTFSPTTSTEIGYVSGVTSSIQTQINSKQSTITGAATTITSSNLTVSRALVSDGSGKVAVSAATSTEVGYLSGVTSSIQSQFTGKQSSIQFKDEGVSIGSSGAVVNVDFTGSGVTASHSAGTVTVNIPGTANGLPTGGTSGQVLIKNSGTNYDASFTSLTLSVVSDVTATSSQVNALATGYYDATSSVQTQIDSKMSNALTNNYMWKGNASNQASPFATGSNGTYLSSVGGVPTWVTPSWTVTSGAVGVTSYTAGDILYASGTTTLTKLGIGSTGQVLTVSGGLPSWTTAVRRSTVTIAGGSTLRSIGSSPQTIIPAPGANKYLNIHSISVSYKYSTAAYNFASSENPAFFLGSGNITHAISYVTINSGSDFNAILFQYNSGVNSVPSVTNTALTLGTTDNGDATTGSGDLDIVVYYTIEDVNT